MTIQTCRLRGFEGRSIYMHLSGTDYYARCIGYNIQINAKKSLVLNTD